ncbi:hypothetical protein P167DRAFT_481120 [Morchella conica CCBAS932]|uniref:Uncharacterized protein n=1 Tax=Morchella conica CCBAS932 TaxID=1392247 RepID=A0A3N4L4K7_9PEZI|nr:hypothetical protein P167DRAFT_481120 [Morchella conica CCBAS932]
MKFITIISLVLFTTLTSAAAIRRGPVSVVDVTSLVPRSSTTSNVLKPINLDAFKSAIGISVRDTVDFSRLDPASQAELMFGSPGNNGSSVLLANMTLYAPDGQQIVMMESFEGLTSAVDCKGDDGTMSLTFTSKEAFDAAVDKWSFINEDEDGSFLLIANHDGCGDADQRQAYTISKIDNEEASLMTILTAKVTPWSEIAGTFDLDFGSATVSPGAARRLMTRGFSDFMDGVVNGVKDVVDGVGDAITGGGDDGSDGLIGVVDDILEDIGNGDVVFDVSSVLDCLDCYITGKFKLVGKVSVEQFNVKALIIDASPQDFNTTMKLNAAIAASVAAPTSLNLTKEIVSFPVPAAGIVIPGIFELGTVMTYEVAVESSIAGTANFTFGLQSTVPNGANIVVDLANIDSSTATGFEAATFDPIFEFGSGSVTTSVMAISRPKLTFGVEVVGVGKLEVGLNLGLPKVGVDLTTKYNETGACDGSSSKTGFGVESKILLDLEVSLNGKFGPGSIIDAGTLYTYEKSIFEKCFPFDIPGLNSTATS